MTGYVRKDTTNNIADGNVINAADLDNEFDGIQSAFNASTGHKHDGTASEGATINVLGPTQDVTISATLVAPKTTNTVDIGSSALKFKDLFLAGNGNIGGTLAVTGVATLTANPVLSGGTANGVTYLNGSKVVTSGSALTFDGTSLGVGIASPTFADGKGIHINNATGSARLHLTSQTSGSAATDGSEFTVAGSDLYIINNESAATIFYNAGSEQMRLTSTGLGIGTSSPAYKLDVSSSAVSGVVANFQATAANTYGTLRLTGNSRGGEVDFYNGSTAQAAIVGGTGNLYFYTNGNSTLQATLDFSGNLGIGTSSPNYSLTSYKGGAVANYLQVASGATGAGSGNGLLLGVDSSGNGVINAQGSVSLLTTVAGVLRTTLDSSGNLSLATGAISSKGSAINDQSIATYGSWTSIQENGFYDAAGNILHNAIKTSGVNDTWNYRFTAPVARYKLLNGVHSWFNAPSGTAGTAITFTQAMTLNASGNLLVGTTSDSGNALIREVAIKGPSNGNARVFVTTNTGVQAQFGVTEFSSSNVGFVGTTTSHPLLFQVNDTERARFNTAGDFLVGTSDSGRTTGIGIKLDIAGYATTPTVSCVGSASTNSADTYHIYSTGAAAYRFYVGYGGTINATSTTITGISDRRLKENIRDLDEGLETVMALKPRKFDWKEGKGKDIKNDRGWIAQEFEAVFPDMIEEWRDPAPKGEEPYKAVNANLIPTLVKAIQEQQAIIDSLKARLDAANL